MSAGPSTATGIHAFPPAARAASCTSEELPLIARALLADLVSAMPAALSATVVTVSPGHRLRAWASSGPAGTDLDLLQAAAGEGPAVTAAAEPDQLVVTGDAFSDPRWQLPATDPGPPVRSVVAAALPGFRAAASVLCVHGAGTELTEPSVVERIAAAVPELAAGVAVVQARLEMEHLQNAVTSNRLIGAAIGVTMHAQKLTYDAAVELLHSISNDTNTRLVQLAENILFTGEVPDAGGRRPRSRRPIPPR